LPKGKGVKVCHEARLYVETILTCYSLLLLRSVTVSEHTPKLDDKWLKVFMHDSWRRV
jgi:hypothetical protein